MKAKTTTILIADNFLLIREGIRSILSGNRDFEIIAEASNSKDLSEKIKTTKPDIVIIDFDLPGYFEIEDIKTINTFSPGTTVLVVSANQDKKNILKVLDYGVNNYILKFCDKEEFLTAVYSTAKKERFLCGKVIDAILEKHFPSCGRAEICQGCEGIKLSHREIEIVQLISQGLTNNEIAQDLFLSIHTVGTHRKNILKKLGFKKSNELIMYAIKTGIIKSPEKG